MKIKSKGKKKNPHPTQWNNTIKIILVLFKKRLYVLIRHTCSPNDIAIIFKWKGLERTKGVPCFRCCYQYFKIFIKVLLLTIRHR